MNERASTFGISRGIKPTELTAYRPNRRPIGQVRCSTPIVVSDPAHYDARTDEPDRSKRCSKRWSGCEKRSGKRNCYQQGYGEGGTRVVNRRFLDSFIIFGN